MRCPLLPLLALAACGQKDDASDDTSADSAAVEGPLSDAVLDALSMDNVKAHVDFLADDALGGRTPGSVGHAAARDYIIAELEAAGLDPAGDDGGFTVTRPLSREVSRWGFDADGEVVATSATESINVAAVLPGRDSEYVSDTIVLMSHYDHLGVTEGGDVYNGAFDDATAVGALLELARVLRDEDVALGRSVLFLITDVEEGGLQGSEGWVADPTLPLEDVVVAISMDPIGRGLLPEYAPLVLMGAEHSPGLRARIDALRPVADGDVFFVNRKPILSFASDQDSFWEGDPATPGLWFVSPGMTWYHTTDDDADTIDYRTVKAHLRFMAQLVADLGADTSRYPEEGEAALSVEDLDEAAKLLRAVIATGELTESEARTADDLAGTLEDGVEANSTDGASGAYLSAAIFLIIDLTEAHPGTVPPPWPD